MPYTVAVYKKPPLYILSPAFFLWSLLFSGLVGQAFSDDKTACSGSEAVNITISSNILDNGGVASNWQYGITIGSDNIYNTHISSNIIRNFGLSGVRLQNFSSPGNLSVKSNLITSCGSRDYVFPYLADMGGGSICSNINGCPAASGIQLGDSRLYTSTIVDNIIRYNLFAGIALRNTGGIIMAGNQVYENGNLYTSPEGMNKCPNCNPLAWRKEIVGDGGISVTELGAGEELRVYDPARTQIRNNKLEDFRVNASNQGKVYLNDIEILGVKSSAKVNGINMLIDCFASSNALPGGSCNRTVSGYGYGDKAGENNLLANNARFGIVVRGPYSQNLVIEGNIIENNMLTSGEDNEICADQPDKKSHAGGGIALTCGARPIIRNNIIRNNGANARPENKGSFSGINMWRAGDALIYDNEIYNNANDGIDILDTPDPNYADLYIFSSPQIGMADQNRNRIYKNGRMGIGIHNEEITTIRVTINNNDVYSNRGIGIGLEADSGGTLNVIGNNIRNNKNNRVNNMRSPGGIGVKGNTGGFAGTVNIADNIIANNYGWNAPGGIGIGQGFKGNCTIYSNAVVRNNSANQGGQYANSPGGIGVYEPDGCNLTIDNNLIDSNTIYVNSLIGGIGIRGNSQYSPSKLGDVKIVSNRVSRHRQRAGEPYPYNAASIGIKYVKFSNKTITIRNNVKDGIGIADSGVGIQIWACSALNSGNRGTIIIEGNRLASFAGAGPPGLSAAIRMMNNKYIDVYIRGNIIDNTNARNYGDYGIEIEGESPTNSRAYIKNLELTGNTIGNVGRCGIRLEPRTETISTGTLIANNIIYSCGRKGYDGEAAGINMRYVRNAKIWGNTVRNNGQRGINLGLDADGVIGSSTPGARNYIYRNGWASRLDNRCGIGIQMSEAGIAVKYNDIYSNYDSGISLDDCGNVGIQNVAVWSNGSDRIVSAQAGIKADAGIRVNACSDITISNSHIHHNKGFGLGFANQAADSVATIISNTIASNSFIGIGIGTYDSTGMTLNEGIFRIGTDSLTGNAIFDNGRSGMVANFRHGIGFDGFAGTAAIIGNSIRGHRAYTGTDFINFAKGIAINSMSSADFLIEGNTLTSNIIAMGVNAGSGTIKFKNNEVADGVTALAAGIVTRDVNYIGSGLVIDGNRNNGGFHDIGTGFSASGVSGPVTVANSIFSNCTVSMRHQSGPLNHSLRVINNKIMGCMLWSEVSGTLDIAGNFIGSGKYDCANGLIALGGITDSILISGNRIKDNRIYSNLISVEGSNNSAAPITIANNDISGARSSGIRIANSKSAKSVICNNTIYNNGNAVAPLKNGISVKNSEGMGIYGNTIYSNANDGIGLEYGACVIGSSGQPNIIRNNGRAGVGVKAGSHIIKFNRLYKNVNAGTEIFSAVSITLTGNEIYSNGSGIQPGSPSAIPDAGIRAYSTAGAVIQGNVVRDNRGMGMSFADNINGQTVTVTGNTIASNWLAGVAVGVDSAAANSGTYNINDSGGANYIRNNGKRAADNSYAGGIGVYSFTGSLYITSNQIKYNDYAGIQLKESTPGTVGPGSAIRNNIIHSNGFAGIALYAVPYSANSSLTLGPGNSIRFNGNSGGGDCPGLSGSGGGDGGIAIGALGDTNTVNIENGAAGIIADNNMGSITRKECTGIIRYKGAIWDKCGQQFFNERDAVVYIDKRGIYRNGILYRSGGRTVDGNQDAAFSRIYSANAAWGIIVASGVTGVRIRNCNIYNNNLFSRNNYGPDGNNIGGGILVGPNAQAEIYSNRIYHNGYKLQPQDSGGSAGIVLRCAAGGTNIYSNYVYDNKSDGINIRDGGYRSGEGIKIGLPGRGNIIYSNGRSGIGLLSPGSAVGIAHNRLWRNIYAGIQAKQVDAGIGSFRVADNQILSNKFSGIALNRVSGYLGPDNVIKYNGGSDGGVFNCSGLSKSGSGDGGISLTGLRSADTVIVSGNIIANNFINTIARSDCIGTVMYNGRRWDRCGYWNANTAAVFITQDGYQLVNATISSPGKPWGVVIKSGVKGVRIRNCIIENNMKYTNNLGPDGSSMGGGILVSPDAEVEIYSNIIRNNGAELVKSTAGLCIDGNTSTEFVTPPMDTEGSHWIVFNTGGNVIRGIRRIRVYTGNNVRTWNVSVSQTLYSAYHPGSKYLDITNWAVGGKAGWQVSGDILGHGAGSSKYIRVDITGGKIKDHLYELQYTDLANPGPNDWYTPQWAEGCTGLYEGYGGNSGIVVRCADPATKILKNVIYNNANDGIDINGSRLTVGGPDEGNIIYSNARNGIGIAGDSNVTIIYNNIYSNKGIGTSFGGGNNLFVGDAVIASNRIARNKRGAIGGSNAVMIEGNSAVSSNSPTLPGTFTVSHNSIFGNLGDDQPAVIGLRGFGGTLIVRDNHIWSNTTSHKSFRFGNATVPSIGILWPDGCVVTVENNIISSNKLTASGAVGAEAGEVVFGLKSYQEMAKAGEVAGPVWVRRLKAVNITGNTMYGNDCGPNGSSMMGLTQCRLTSNADISITGNRLRNIGIGIQMTGMTAADEGSNTIDISRNNIYSSYSYFIQAKDNNMNVAIRGNDFRKAYSSDGIEIKNGNRAYNFNISNNYISTVYGGGIKMAQMAGNTLILGNNIIQNTGYPGGGGRNDHKSCLSVAADANSGVSGRIYGNTLKNATGIGLEIYHPRDMLITNNLVCSNGYGVDSPAGAPDGGIALDGPENVTIRSNTLRRNKGFGFAAKDSSVSGISFIGNRIYGNKHGAGLQGIEGAVIASNYVYSNSDNGVRFINANDIMVRNNQVWSNGSGNPGGQVAENLTLGGNTGQNNCVKLNAGSSGTDDYYNGMLLKIMEGSADPKTVLIYDYDGVQKLAYVKPAFSKRPAGTERYRIITTPNLAIGAASCGNITVYGNTVKNNRTPGVSVNFSAGTVNIENNTIISNVADRQPGGVGIDRLLSGAVTVRGNTVINNSVINTQADVPGGIGVVEPVDGTVYIDDNIIASNIAPDKSDVGGIGLRGNSQTDTGILAAVFITSNRISNHRSGPAPNQAGVAFKWLYPYGVMYIRNNTKDGLGINGNACGIRYQQLKDGSGDISIQGNLILDNKNITTNGGVGIEFRNCNYTNVDIDNNIISNCMWGGASTAKQSDISFQNCILYSTDYIKVRRNRINATNGEGIRFTGVTGSGTAHVAKVYVGTDDESPGASNNIINLQAGKHAVAFVSNYTGNIGLQVSNNNNLEGGIACDNNKLYYFTVTGNANISSGQNLAANTGSSYSGIQIGRGWAGLRGGGSGNPVPITISRNTIKNNRNSGARIDVGLVYLNLSVVGNIIASNASGFLAKDDTPTNPDHISTLVFSGNLVYGNGMAGGSDLSNGRGFAFQGIVGEAVRTGKTRIVNNIFRDNLESGINFDANLNAAAISRNTFIHNGEMGFGQKQGTGTRLECNVCYSGHGWNAADPSMVPCLGVSLGTAVISNNLVYNNLGIGIASGLYGGISRLYYNTVFKNLIGVRGNTTTMPELKNCIIWGNTGGQILPGRGKGSGPAPAATYCDVEGGYFGTGNINSDPKFFSGIIPPYDLRIYSNSPCIDNAAAVSGINTDYTGASRPYDVAGVSGGDGSQNDIGAYEFHGNPNTPPVLRNMRLSDQTADPEAAGAGYTNSNTVDIALAVAKSYPLNMLLCENSDFSGCSETAYANPAAYTLSAGDGNKKVYAKVKNAYGESNTYSGDIILDTVPPAVPGNTLTIPNGGENWFVNTEYAIVWSKSLISDANLKSAPVRLEYSLDGGSSYTLIASNLANNGLYTWKTPATTSANARIRIWAGDRAGNRASDISDTAFNIAMSDSTWRTPGSVYANSSRWVNPGYTIDKNCSTGAYCDGGSTQNLPAYIIYDTGTNGQTVGRIKINVQGGQLNRWFRVKVSDDPGFSVYTTILDTTVWPTVTGWTEYDTVTGAGRYIRFEIWCGGLCTTLPSARPVWEFRYCINNTCTGGACE